MPHRFLHHGLVGDILLLLQVRRILHLSQHLRVDVHFNETLKQTCTDYNDFDPSARLCYTIDDAVNSTVTSCHCDQSMSLKSVARASSQQTFLSCRLEKHAGASISPMISQSSRTAHHCDPELHADCP